MPSSPRGRRVGQVDGCVLQRVGARHRRLGEICRGPGPALLRELGGHRGDGAGQERASPSPCARSQGRSCGRLHVRRPAGSSIPSATCTRGACPAAPARCRAEDPYLAEKPVAGGAVASGIVDVGLGVEQLKDITDGDAGAACGMSGRPLWLAPGPARPSSGQGVRTAGSASRRAAAAPNRGRAAGRPLAFDRERYKGQHRRTLVEQAEELRAAAAGAASMTSGFAALRWVGWPRLVADRTW
jgi:hypothetical protein